METAEFILKQPRTIKTNMYMSTIL